MAMQSKSFHNFYDVDVRGYQTSMAATRKPSPKYITLRDRSLTYQFFPHFHPYVLKLIQCLNEGGISGLQDSDTLYMPRPGDSHELQVLPDSTRATLAAGVTATRPDGTVVALPTGTALTLPDNTMVRIPAGTPVSTPDNASSKLAADAFVILPGNIPLSLASGIQWTILGKETIVLDYTAATLPIGAAEAVVTDDGSPVTLPNGTGIILRSGLPKPILYDDGIFSGATYNPDPKTVQHPYPVKDLDFTLAGAYSIYNWELFFQAPLLIAIHLSQNQKFQDAQKWFHYIFNPTDNSPGPTPGRFWRVKPLQYTDVRMIEEVLLNLSTHQDLEQYKQTVNSINAWMENPFQPFVVAKYRPTSYMLKTVMAYLDNIIAWGDSLFRQYTIETNNEATQLYIIAANMLGPKPQPVPKKGSVKPLTYNDLRGKLDPFGNVLTEMEVDIPFDIGPMPVQGTNSTGTHILAGIGQTLYFCIPRNDKLLSYWDTVADRLFKIHNSLNIQGIFQKLPLYEAPIDPALLVRAAASGLDVNAIVSGLNQPLPLLRFQLLISKAVEICQEVKSLGANLLAAIEKQDNESLALMRAQNESKILGLAEMIKYSQWQDAIKAREGLDQSLDNAMQRYAYYQKLLGRTDAQIKNSIPQLDGVDQSGLQNLNFQSSEPQMDFDSIKVDISQDSASVSDGEVKTLIGHEVEELDKLSLGRYAQLTATGLEGVASGLATIPQFKAHGQPMGCGVTVDFGGQQLHSMISSTAAVARSLAEEFAYQANNTAKLGSYSRRETEWLFQSNSAVGEINQIFKQLRGAQIREAIAEKEYKNHQTQMEQAQGIVDFLQGNEAPPGFQVKETTTGFYAWMKRETKALHAKAFQLAFEVAKKAERAMQRELGDPSLSYIQYNYLDGTEGLLAGEKLLFDIKAMEMAYHDLNQREYELTKHVSLLQVAPLALVQLRATGSCNFTLPEELFDLDGPGQYFRRCKSLALTVPCVTGPYTNVSCTVTLEKSSIRTSTSMGDGYVRKGSDDPRFEDYYGTAQSIVTSSGQSDSGLFEVNLRDERFLPFEGAGIAGSQWRLTIPAEVRQFDFDTINDVILHIRYTAREGGETLRVAAVENLEKQIKTAQTVGSVRLFSLRHEFPSEWAKFRSVTTGDGTPLAGLSINLRSQHYPFWAQDIVGSGAITSIQLFAEMLPADKATGVNVYDKADKTGHSYILSQNPLLGTLLSGDLGKITTPPAPPAMIGPLTLYFDSNSMKELWLAVTWGKA